MIGRYLALTVAPGGLGKSSLVNAEVLAMVTGRPLLGSKPTRPLRVWLWNGEDDRDEAERRITAAAVHYGVTAGDIGDRLFLDSGRDRPMMLVAQGRDGPIAAREQVDAFRWDGRGT